MRLYKTQYSFRISGNRGYDSNRVRYIAISGLPAWRPANWDALHVCFFVVVFFFFMYVLLTHYDLNYINSVLYAICYEFSPIY